MFRTRKVRKLDRKFENARAEQKDAWQVSPRFLPNIM